MHKYAIAVLDDWINEFPNKFGIDEVLNTSKERQFWMDGFIEFVPDLVVYDKDGITSMYEVVNTHALDGFKLHKMQYLFYVHGIDIPVYEIKADYILRQTQCPNTILMIKMN